MPAERSIRNILFDLGGVILDIDVQATLKAFYELGFPARLLQYPMNLNTDLFFRYETGKISNEDFRDELRRESGVDASDQELDAAWNAMIVRIPEERTRLIARLGRHYRLLMLSNTSPLHAPVFEEMYLKSSGIAMKEAFEKIYSSFEIGCHKSDHEALLMFNESPVT